MVKSILKKIINNNFIKKRILDFYQINNNYTEHDIYEYFIRDNVWFFSQPKSGTTLICNTIAFYNAELIGQKNYSFNSVSELGIGRSLMRDLSEVEKLIIFKSISKLNYFINTHWYVKNAKPKLLIQSYRNAYDQCESAYYYWYKNRKNYENIKVDKALPHLIDNYCETYLWQKKAFDENQNKIIICYDDLKNNLQEFMSTIIKSLYNEVDHTKLNKAMEKSSIKSVKQYEGANGPLEIMRKGTFSGSSFIRSGEIGTGKNFFNESQIELITKKLSERNVPVSGKI